MSSIKKVNIFQYLSHTTTADGIQYNGSILKEINNDLYLANLELEKFYKNCKIEFKDKNNNDVIPYGLVFTKNRKDNLYYSVSWTVKDKDNKIVVKGFFIK